jgi:1-acyl-sn-glycerol-3-phosphate acyltransferase
MMKKIFVTSFTFFVIGLVAILLMPVAIILSITNVIGLRRTSSELMYKIVKFASSLIVVCAGCRLVVSGAENIPPRGKSGVCFVSNHSGIMDILLLFITAGRPVGFIAKKEIMFVPLINLWLILLGGVFIDRNNPRKSFAAINRGVKKIKKGYSIVVFPEGTRSRGRGLLPFKSGSFRLATAAGADIVPVALTGSYEVFEKTGWVCSREVYVSFGKVIKTDPTDSSEKRRLVSQEAHDEIARLLATPPQVIFAVQ